MKQRIPFSQFLSSRYTPCVFCLPSKDVKEKYPDCEKQILTEWSKIQSKSNFRVRLVFPDSIPSFQDIQTNVTDLRAIYPHSSPYDFLNIDSLVIHRTELDSISLLRQRFLETDIMPMYLWCDLPISLLTIAIENEQPSLPQKIPSWCKRRLLSLKNNLLRFPHDNLSQPLLQLQNNILPERFQEAITLVEQNYQKYWTGWGKNIGFFNSNPDDQNNSIIALKFYADMKMITKKHDEASSLYLKLVDNIPSNNSNFLSQVHFLRAINDILGKQMTQSTTRALHTTIQFSTPDKIIFHQSILIDFWVRIHISLNPKNTLDLISSSKDTSKFTNLVRPFIIEQIATISSLRRYALKLTLAAEYYSQIEFRENAIKCLWKSANVVKRERWELLHQQLIEQMGQSLLTQNIDISQALGELMSSRNIYHPDVIYQLLKAYPTEKVFCGGFVKARIHSFESKGFPASKPRDFKGASWFMTGERLFGAFTRGRFFTKSQLEKYECAIGTPVHINVCITSTLNNFPLTNVRLRIDGYADPETTSVVIDYPQFSIVDLSFTPKKAGNIRVSGIYFNWGDVINLTAPFMDNMLYFQVYEEAPQIHAEIIGNVKTNLLVGETTKFEVRITNNSFPLKYLSVLINSEIPTILYDPVIEDIFGQYFLTPLQTNEELIYKIAVHADKPGTFKLMLIMPYWRPNPPPRYEFISVDFNVRKVKSMEFKSDKSKFSLRCPKNYKPLGFISPKFNANMFLSQIKGMKVFFDFVTCYKEVNEIELPEFVKHFQVNSGLSFWFYDEVGNGYVEYLIPAVDFHVTVIIKKDNEFTSLIIKNIGKRSLTDIKVSIISPVPQITFILSGKDLLAIDDMVPEETAVMKFKFVSLNDEIKPQLLIAHDQYICIEDIDLY